MSKRDLDNKKNFWKIYYLDIPPLILILDCVINIILPFSLKNFVFNYKELLAYWGITLGIYLYLVVGKRIKFLAIHFLISIMFVINFLLLFYNKWL